MTIGELKNLIKDIPDDTIVARKLSKREWVELRDNDVEIRVVWTPDEYSFHEFQNYESDVQVSILSIGD